uniref:CLASP_N domain-containing protein n=1 Tax=Heligmosomoides polygyrus TaxID=6339 RepID=A0A183FNX5_HELPZ
LLFKGIRKAVCEVFVEVARNCSPSVRRVQLAQTFVKLLHDPSRWVSVWYTAFQELGPFIATFANSKLSGLKIKDGQVLRTVLLLIIPESEENVCNSPFCFSDELVAFGSSKSVPSAPSYLERRFDVLYMSPQRAGNSMLSPRRSRNSGSSDDGELVSMAAKTRNSSRTTSGQGDETELFKIVPQELVDNFMGMVLPGGMMDSDINRHCAHNFPAVAYTLGRANWPQLRDTYNKLATDDQLRVRVSIANSIHEMAAIVGARHTDDDLLPVFHAYRSVGTLRSPYPFQPFLERFTSKHTSRLPLTCFSRSISA